MISLIWARGLLLRRPARLLGAVLGIAVAVALLASIGAFLSASKATMTRRAITQVAVDWQVEAQPGADPSKVARVVAAEPGVRQASPVSFALTTGLTATTSGTTQTTGPGVVIGIGTDYASRFPGMIRPLTGARTGALVAQQTAANLHLKPGDTVTIGRAGQPDATVTIAGVVDLPNADSLFQKVGAAVGAQPQAPPDNVLIVPAAQWHRLFGPLAAVSGQTHTQIHVTLDHALPSDPSSAFGAVTSRAHHLEAVLAGTGLVGDNLAAALDAARADALYAQMLFLFLGLPGAVLAGLLTVAVASSGAGRRQAEQALMRARGATGRQLAGIGLAEAMLIGCLGSFVGLAVALTIGRITFGTVGFGTRGVDDIIWGVGAFVVGIGIAVASIGVPAWRAARVDTVAGRRRAIGRERRPLWMRCGVDVALLAASALVFWFTARNGYRLVLVPEGVPTISVSYWAFAGPTLLWVGAGLFAWRISDLVLRRRGPMSAVLRPLAHRLAPSVAASMSRQRRLLSRSLVLVALTISFAVSTAVFNSTYRHQSAVDAVLTNGADVTVTESPSAQVGPSAAGTMSALDGVRHVEPLQHRFAYVGADLQDLYGVRPATIVGAGKLQDAYFRGGTASALVAKLAARPDSILVSQETVRDFQLQPGDPLTLRLQDGRTQKLTSVRFHYAGIAREFPTAPRDSFLVANAAYVARMTGSDAVRSFLVDTGDRAQTQVADRLRASLGSQATVTDVVSSRRIVASSLTAVDLAGLSQIELGFALVLGAAATGLVLALSLAERRRTFAIVRALGADQKELRGVVLAEAAFVTIGGAIAGLAGAWLLSAMLVNVLSNVFDPPPDQLSVPWAYLALLGGVAVVALTVAVAGSARSISRSSLSTLREPA